jgi:hypothetical protein
MDKYVDDQAQAPEQPLPFRFPQPQHRNKYRWVLYLFVAAVLAGAIYVGWRIVDAWEGILEHLFS